MMVFHARVVYVFNQAQPTLLAILCVHLDQFLKMVNVLMQMISFLAALEENVVNTKIAFVEDVLTNVISCVVDHMKPVKMEDV